MLTDTDTNNFNMYYSNEAAAKSGGLDPTGAPAVAVGDTQDTEWVVTYLDKFNRIHSSVVVAARSDGEACDRGWELIPEGLEDFMLSGPGYEWSQEDLDRLPPYREAWRPDPDTDYSAPGFPMVEHEVDYLDDDGKVVRRETIMATSYHHGCMIILLQDPEAEFSVYGSDHPRGYPVAHC